MWISPLQAILRVPVHTNWVSYNLTQIPQVKGLVLQDSLIPSLTPPPPHTHTSDDSCMVGPQVSPELLSVLVTTPFSDSIICQHGSQNSGEKQFTSQILAYYRGYIKDLNEQPDEERHRMTSGRVPSTGTSVPVGALGVFCFTNSKAL